MYNVGLPALFDKWTRAKMAIKNGVDLIIELPVCYSTASAEYFALGSIGILDSLGIIDCISFGNNCDNIEILKRIANILHSEPPEYKKLLQAELKKGNSFPISRSNALKKFLKKEYDEKILTEILLDSNNILGIEYLKALLNYDSPITPFAIKRKGPNYNSINIENDVCSATAIREIFQSGNLADIPKVVPENCYDIITKEIAAGKSPMFIKNFEKEILYTLRKANIEELSKLADINEGLENVLKKCANEDTQIENLIENIKSKRYTKTRIQRILLHALLNITQETLEKSKTSPQYIRVLAYSSKGKKLLSQIANKSRIPLITSVNKFLKTATDTQKEMLKQDILATDIYTLGYQMPKHKKMNLDYTMPVEEIK